MEDQQIRKLTFKGKNWTGLDLNFQLVRRSKHSPPKF